MHYLQVKNLHKSYSDKILFDGIDFAIMQGQKIALVAKNGAGKSTLLDILMGRSDAPVGDIAFTHGITVAYLAQSLPFDPQKTVMEVLIHHDNKLGKHIMQYEAAIADSTTSAEQLQLLLDAIEENDARSFETKVKTIISKLQLHNLLHQAVWTLSGGEGKRVALATTLLSEPDFLILDEPTNHLDLEMIEWLEKELKSSSLTLLMVSHDRYFVERVCTHIFELEEGKLYTYTGWYDAYLDQKATRLEQAIKQAHIMKQTVRRELERVRKAPRARGTKSVKRVADFQGLTEKAQSLQNTVTQSKNKLELHVAQRRLWGKVIQIHSLNKRYGEKIILDDFSYDFKAGERIGIIGKNGVGKSTFIQILLNHSLRDSGQIKIGESVVIGHYQQGDIDFHTDKTVLDVVREHAESITIGGKTLSASKLLERFLFSPNQQYTRAYMLSGGEKRRLHLLTVLIKNPNFLILDEPSNDLDLITLNILEEFLLQYEGCLIIVSHDRFFMDRIVDHLFVFEWAGKITPFRGNYSQRREQANKESKKEAVLPKASTTNEPNASLFPPKKSLSYNEKREFQDLEKEIAQLQEAQEAINMEFQSPTPLSHEQIKALSLKLGKVCQQLEKAEMRWIELAERR